MSSVRPLAIIDGNAHRLLRRIETVRRERIVSGLNKISATVTRLTELMECALNTARLEEVRIVFLPSTCDATDMIQDLASDYAEVNPDHSLQLDLARLPRKIYADGNL